MAVIEVTGEDLRRLRNVLSEDDPEYLMDEVEDLADLMWRVEKALEKASCSDSGRSAPHP